MSERLTAEKSPRYLAELYKIVRMLLMLIFAPRRIFGVENCSRLSFGMSMYSLVINVYHLYLLFNNHI